MKICFSFLVTKIFLRVNFVKAFSSDYERKACSVAFANAEKYNSPLRLVIGLLVSAAALGPADHLLPRPSPTVLGRGAAVPVPGAEQGGHEETKEMVSSREACHCHLPGQRACDSPLRSKLTPDKSGSYQPWEIWCHL